MFCVFFFFSLLLFKLERLFFKTSGMREVDLIRVVGRVHGWIFIFIYIFLSQIYAFTSTSGRHPPLNCDHRRLLVLPPKATVAWVTGDGRVVIMRQRVISLWARVMATVRLFRAYNVVLYGVRSAAGWLKGQRVTYTCRFPAKIVPHAASLGGVFLFVVFLYSLCFSSHSLHLYYSIFTGLSVGW